jgi:hypothetical protein
MGTITCKCFWCDRERGDTVEIDDVETQTAIVDYHPCARCEAIQAGGITFVELVEDPPTPRPPVQTYDGLRYPTGRWCMVERSSALLESLNEGVRKDAVDTGIVMCDTECIERMLREADAQGVPMTGRVSVH